MDYLKKHLVVMGHPKEIRLDDAKRLHYVRETLTRDILPHLGDCFIKKAYFLGYMVRKLLMYFLDFCEEDDRDSYTKKRVDTPGILMANLTRQYVTKMIKEMRNVMMKEMNSGNLRYTNSIDDLINATNVYKIIKSSTVEAGLKFCLSTGNWGLKNFSTKVGVAQVLNRLSFNATNSHRRRINTPIDHKSKLIQPRKLHSTCWGYICPSETPEGGSIGGVKNMSLTCEITSNVDTSFVISLLLQAGALSSSLSSSLSTDKEGDEGGEGEHGSSSPRWISAYSTSIVPSDVKNHVVVFVNGDILGFTTKPIEIMTYISSTRHFALSYIDLFSSFSPRIIDSDGCRTTIPRMKIPRMTIPRMKIPFLLKICS